jgi:hypothetical protein
MANENNPVAPVSTDNATATPATAVSTAEVSKVDSKATVNTTPEAPAFDPRTNYDALKSQFESLNKSYSELRRYNTQQSQGYSELKKQIDNMVNVFKEATKQEISPEDFMKALQSQGVKALDPLFQQRETTLKSTYDKQLESLQAERASDRVQIEELRRIVDTTTYPDFVKLKPVMNEIANADNCPIDWGQDIGVIYDTLYKLAKAASAESAIKEAHSQGLKEAEAKVAREAGTAVATGGKSASVSNPADIKDLGKLREYFVAQLGEAE